ncbi:hypothetical protein [Bradyrhizobium sp. URHC0002]
MHDPAAPDDRLAFALRRLFLYNGQHFRGNGRVVATRLLGQKAFKAFNELIAAGKVTPALRQQFMVTADRGIDRVYSAVLCIGRPLETIRNMPIKFEEQGPFLPRSLPNS